MVAITHHRASHALVWVVDQASSIDTLVWYWESGMGRYHAPKSIHRLEFADGEGYLEYLSKSFETDQKSLRCSLYRILTKSAAVDT